jgi:hypothetical protein
MNHLYVAGARQRSLLFKEEEEQFLYENALIVQLDTATNGGRICVEYKSPLEVRAGEQASNAFKCGTLVGNKLYVCTSTEILIFEVPAFKQVGYISLPCFNDLHHVAPTLDGNLLIANTGLDMVIKITPEGKILREWDVLNEDPWRRFSRQVDYRKVDSTKPHRSHPNYVFQLGTEVWVTRFAQRDAICLNDSGKRINIQAQAPHDGLVFGDRIFFTTVDGKIVIANRHTLALDEIIDLQTIDKGENTLLGWCRGLLPLDERRMWVGFSRVRKTKFKENILWVKQVLREGVVEMPTHLALYDIVEKRCLQEIDVEQYGLNAVFSIFPADPLVRDNNPPVPTQIEALT